MARNNNRMQLPPSYTPETTEDNMSLPSRPERSHGDAAPWESEGGIYALIEEATPILRTLSILVAVPGTLLCAIGLTAAKTRVVVPGLPLIPIWITALFAMFIRARQNAAGQDQRDKTHMLILRTLGDITLFIVHLGITITVYILMRRWPISQIVLATWVTFFMFIDGTIHIILALHTLGSFCVAVRERRFARSAGYGYDRLADNGQGRVQPAYQDQDEYHETDRLRNDRDGGFEDPPRKRTNELL